MSSPLARGVPSVSNSASAEASAMKAFQSTQLGVLPGNLAWYLSTFTTTPPYSRLYSMGTPLRTPLQVAPASGASKNSPLAASSVTTSAGTSATFAAKLQIQLPG